MGEWSQYANHLAAFTSAGWRFVTPVVGIAVVVKTSGMVAAYGVAGWELGTLRASQLLINGEQVVGARASAIAGPVGGTTVDSEARITLDQILSALRTHGLIST